MAPKAMELERSKQSEESGHLRIAVIRATQAKILLDGFVISSDNK